MADLHIEKPTAHPNMDWGEQSPFTGEIIASFAISGFCDK
jgi:hypothetical protein